MLNGVRVLGWGKGVPGRCIHNDDWAKHIDTSDEWIRSRTGMEERRFIAPGEDVLSLASQAGEMALNRAGIPRERIRVVLVATFSPAARMPGVAPQLQKKLGLAEDLLAYDINGACTGFIQGLETARALLGGDPNGAALVIGADTISPWINRQDRSTAVLFGDGAGAVVIEAADALYQARFGTEARPELLTVAPNEQGVSFVTMDGTAVFRFALQRVPSLLQALAEDAMLPLQAVDRFILHQANGRILDKVAQRLDVPLERFESNLARYGNTSAASVPLALCEAAEAGRLQRGMNVALAGFGAGMAWGGMIYEW